MSKRMRGGTVTRSQSLRNAKEADAAAEKEGISLDNLYAGWEIIKGKAVQCGEGVCENITAFYNRIK